MQITEAQRDSALLGRILWRLMPIVILIYLIVVIDQQNVGLASYQVRALGLLTVGSALGNMFGSLMGGAFPDMDGWLGFAGWQWVFIATGVPAILVTLLTCEHLPDSPAKARFLSDDERKRLAVLVERERIPVQGHSSIWTALTDPRTAFFSLLYMLILMALYGVIYWLPTAIKGSGVSGSVNGVLNAIPWAIASVILVVLPRYLRKEKAVLSAIIGIALLGVACFFVSVTAESVIVRHIALAVGTPCISLVLPCFWSIPLRYFKGAHAAASIALISGFGNVGGFAAQNLMRCMGKRAGDPGDAMYIPAACHAVLAVRALALLVRSPAKREPAA